MSNVTQIWEYGKNNELISEVADNANRDNNSGEPITE